MVVKRRSGPTAMSDHELAEFLSAAPKGAICILGEDDHLLALPARVVDFDDATLTIDVDGAERHLASSGGAQACLVADTFATYRAIRGVISQGTVSWPPTEEGVARMTVSRTVTFSFANA
jgi:hypothetical protein